MMVIPGYYTGGLAKFDNSGISESLPKVNRSELTKEEAFNERESEFKSYDIGLQVPFGLDSKVPRGSTLWAF